MTIEEKIFQKAKIDSQKLEKYGFKKENNVYKYSKNIMNNTFYVDIEIINDKNVIGKIYDLNLNEEYTNFRIEDITGSYTSQVREEFINVLKDIRNNCSIVKKFIYDQTNRIAEKIEAIYGDKPEFKWEKFPGYAIFKNSLSHKWYGIIMNIDKSKISSDSKNEVEIINLKLNPDKIIQLLKQNGYYPAYHMNKKNWISVILDNTISDEDIMALVAESYFSTITNKK